jgi:hypothetical protein
MQLVHICTYLYGSLRHICTQLRGNASGSATASAQQLASRTPTTSAYGASRMRSGSARERSHISLTRCGYSLWRAARAHAIDRKTAFCLSGPGCRCAIDVLDSSPYAWRATLNTLPSAPRIQFRRLPRVLIPFE